MTYKRVSTGAMFGQKTLEKDVTIQKLTLETKELNLQIEELKNDKTEKERYFNKLVLIEEVLKKKGIEMSKLGEGIMEIIYASPEENVKTLENGDVSITHNKIKKERVVNIDVSSLECEIAKLT